MNHTNLNQNSTLHTDPSPPLRTSESSESAEEFESTAPSYSIHEWIEKTNIHSIRLQKDFFHIFLFATLGIFWGQGKILYLFDSLGMAYISLFFGEGFFFFLCLVMVGIGSSSLNRLKLITLLTTALAIQLTLGRFVGREEKGKKAILAGCSMLLSGIFFAISQGGLSFYFVMAVVESLIVILISYLAQNGLHFFWQPSSNWSPSKEEILGLLFLFSGTLVGMSSIEIPFFQEFLISFFCAYFIGLCSRSEGMSGGATAGLVLGFLLYICGSISSETFALLGMAGLITGGVRDLGRGVMALVLLLSPLFVIFYQDKDAYSILWLQGFIAGSISFALTPQKIVNLFQGQIFIQEKAKNNYIRKKELLESKLYDFSKAFYTLGQTFKPTDESSHKTDIVKLVDKIAENACSTCSVAHYCWEEDLYRSYGTTVNALSCCEEKGRVRLSDMPIEFQNICAKREVFVEEVNQAYELYRKDKIWLGRLQECRQLVGQQMEAVGELLKELSGEMDISCVFLESSAKALKEAFSKMGITLQDVRVIEYENGIRKQVEFSVKSCGTNGVCRNKYGSIVSDIIGKPMQLKEKNICHTSEKGMCRLTYTEIPSFQLTTASAYASASNAPTGDTTSFLITEHHVAIMAVSDGMGHGKKASEQSNTAIELLEQFSEAGFERKLAVKMINSALLLQKESDSYATLDICAVDLFKGKAEFIKLGAVSSYIFRNERIQTITSHTLPAGILEEVEVIETELYLKDGDILLLMTDGITEVLGGDTLTGAWLKEKLLARPMSNPEDISTYILKEAQEVGKNQECDDMTVLVARFWKKRKF